MKKVLLPLLLLAVYCVPLHAQVSINTDGTTPDASAMLDIKSTKYGALMPRMTTAQRTAIASPADGLWVYDTDTKTFWFYKGGTGWTQLTTGGGGGGGFLLPYKATVKSVDTLFSITNSGAGAAAHFEASADTNTSNVLSATSYGPGVIADHTKGNTANFFINNQYGVGAGVRGEVNSIFGNNGTAGVYGSSSGTGGYGGYFDHTDSTGYGFALYATSNGLGPVVEFDNYNAKSTSNTLSVTNNGGGVIADHSQGNAANFFINNTNGVGAGVRGEVNSIFGNNGTAGVYGVASGTGGYGGYFEHTNTSGYGYALYATTSGLGSTAYITSDNDASTANTLNVISNVAGVIADHSQGNTGNFVNTNTNGVAAGVRGEVNSIFGNNGTAGVYGVASGTGGYGGYFEHTETTGYGNALYATTSGLGSTAYITSNNDASTANTLNVISNVPGVISDHSQGNTGNFVNTNTNGVAAGVRGEVNSIFGNNGTAGVYGVASGPGGYGGYFEHTETTGYGIALEVVSNDRGTAMVVDHEGSGNIAVFQAAGSDVARIDHNGRGYFNGGTQNSGADLAEAFDVEGPAADYEAGDVLLISTTADRTVVRSYEAYSNLVAGVYATKPGVLLTEDSVGSTLAGKVPMGVVGVIPTKVCGENGVIHRGDILVTSTRTGYAMKADLNKLKAGQAIGKALEEFSGETGKIKVLVNVK